uniref:Acyltransferase n=1 Tax=Schlesneria paludicola TaxID=360056 RepID=A0A7C2NZH3_9PLAN
MSAMHYRPEIDGLRAVAVLSVVLCHAGLGCSGGFTGVDVFFVISGYLITGIVLRDLECGTFTLAGFWERRVRRILPALVVLMGFVLAVGSWVLLPRDLVAMSKSALAQVAFAANIFFWRDVGGYFAANARFKPLLHMWSLAVEEQFYVLFPLMLVGLRRLMPRRLVSILTALALASFAASVAGLLLDRRAAVFYLLPTRAWELLIGAVLASMPSRTMSRRSDEVLSLIGLAAILWPVFSYTESTLFPGAAALPSCLGTALVIWTNTPERTAVGRWLASPPMVGVGLISYSLYLWHWPLLVFERYAAPAGNRWRDLPAVVASIVLAYLSWRFVETPFRRAGRGLPRALVFRSGVAAQMLIATFAGVPWISEGMPTRFPANNLGDIAWIGDEYFAPPADIEAGRFLELGAADDDERRTPEFLLWGDSHAGVAAYAMEHLAKQHGVTGSVVVTDGSPPLPDAWPRYSAARAADLVHRNQAILREIRARKIPHVILVARWSVYVEGYPASEMWHEGHRSESVVLLTDQRQTQGDPEATPLDVFQRHLRELTDQLSAEGVHVWIVQQVPEQDGPIATEVLRQLWRGTPDSRSLSTVSRDEHLRRQARVNRVLQQLAGPNVTIIDPSPYCFDETGQAIVVRDGRAQWRDNDHLTQSGALAILSPALAPVMACIAGERTQEGRLHQTLGNRPEGTIGADPRPAESVDAHDTAINPAPPPARPPRG